MYSEINNSVAVPFPPPFPAIVLAEIAVLKFELLFAASKARTVTE